MSPEASEYACEQQDRISYRSFYTEPAASRQHCVVQWQYSSAASAAFLRVRVRVVLGLGHEHSDCWDTDHCTPKAPCPCRAGNKASQYTREKELFLRSPVFPTPVMTKPCEGFCLVIPDEELPRTCNGEGGIAFACFSTKTRNEGDTAKKGDKDRADIVDGLCAPLPVRSITLNGLYSHTHSWAHAISLFSMQHVCALGRTAQIVNSLVWSATSWSACSPVC